MTDISVIIPCYNHGHYLDGAIQSVLSQQYPNLEMIVVDDGSKDDTAEVAGQHHGQIQYIHKENAGLSAARNTGIGAAGGSWLHFLDADDQVRAGFYSNMMVEAHRQGDTDLVVGGWEDISPDGELLASHDPTDELKLKPLEAWLRANNAPSHCYMIRRSAVETIGGFDESLLSHEDWDLWLRVLLGRSSIAMARDAVAVYQRRAGSMSTNRRRMSDSAVQVFRNVLLDDRLHGQYRDIAKSTLCYWEEQQIQAARWSSRDLLHERIPLVGELAQSLRLCAKDPSLASGFWRILQRRLGMNRLRGPA